MDEKLKQILNNALKLFREYGIKSISMDDISKSMHISKKTLYKFVSNKTELIQKLFIDYFEEEYCLLQMNILNKNANAIDTVFELHKFIYSDSTSINVTIKHDLKNFYPDIYNTILTNSLQLSESFFKYNIKTGQEQGLYRKDIDDSMIAFIFSQVILLIEKPELQKFPIENMVNEITELFILRICNQNGLEYYNQKLP